MTSFVTIRSTGSVKTETTIFQSKKNFENFLSKEEKLKKHKQVHTFEIGIVDNCIAVYAREDGNEKNINKYDIFPPPLDTTLFYDSIVLIKYSNTTEKIMNFTATDFNQFIDNTHNGFDDCSDDERSEDSTSTDLDGFIVHSDDEVSESDYSDDGL